MHPCREGGRGGGASICQVNLIGCIQPEVAGKKIRGKKYAYIFGFHVSQINKHIREDFLKSPSLCIQGWIFNKSLKTEGEKCNLSFTT